MPDKWKLLAVGICLLLILNTTGAATAETNKPSIKASSAILMDAKTGRVLLEKEMHKKRAPASLTKMMTCILAIELGSGDEIVTVSSRGSGNKVGSDIDLRRQDQLTLADLTKAALIVSANDAAIVIGEQIGGSEKHFLDMMNKKAKSMGAVNTNFSNTNGYSDPDHYSTAYDLALIARYSLQNPVFAQIVNTEETEIDWLNKDKKLTLINSNRLQRQYDWITGIKTGTANTAGKCLAVSGEIDDQVLIAIVLNCGDRYGEAQRLLEYGFSLKREVVSVGTVVDQFTLEKAIPDIIQLQALEKVDLLITEEEIKQLEVKIIYDEEKIQQLPLSAGEKIGQGNIYLNEQLLAEFPVGTNQAVKAKKWWE